MEKQFRQSALKKGQDTDIWITELEDYKMKVHKLGSSFSDNQFILIGTHRQYSDSLGWSFIHVWFSDRFSDTCV
jgi:hypothetical protein